MAIFYPDILEHNNPAKALVDITQLRGTSYPLGTLSQTGSIPTDKRNLGTMVFVSSSQEFYGFYGQTTGSSDWDNPTNWKVLSTPSGSFSGAFSGAFTGSFSGSVTAPGSNTQIVFNSGGTLAANSGLVYSGSNVGIGTTSPGYKLDVIQDSGNTFVARFFNDGNDQNRDVLLLQGGTDAFSGNTRFIEFRDGDGTTVGMIQGGLASTVNSGLQINAGINEDARHLVIKENGNVGLGINLPSASLHISGASSANLLRIESPASSSILFVSGSGQVGIGTSALSNNLLTVGSSAFPVAYFNSILSISPSSYIVSKTIYSGTGRNIFPNSIETPLLVVGTTTANATGVLHVRGTGTTSATTALRVENANASASLVVLDNGNVGIGTTAPTLGKLEVKSVDNYAVTPFALAVHAPSQSPYIGGFFNDTKSTTIPVATYFGWDNGDFNMGTLQGKFFLGAGGTLNNGSTIRMTIDNTSGNVGIGTTTPTQKLTVAGDALITGSLTVQGTVTAKEFKTEFVSASITYISGSHKFGDSADDVHQFTGSVFVNGPVTATSFTGSFSGSVSGPVTAPGSDTQIVFNSGGLLSADSGLVYSGSRVGIGTTSPAGKLDVRAGSGGRIIFGSFDANYYAAFEGGDQLNFYNGASNTTAYINYNGPSDVVLGRNLRVEGNPSGGTAGAVRIKSDGRVGIGTTAPSASLHISGASSANLLQIQSPASANILFVSGSGNVGIGTASPTGHQLDIVSTQGNVGNSAIRALYPGGGSLTNTEFGALAYRNGVWTAIYGRQGNASSAGYFDGNVGISVSIPSASLHISGASTGNLLRIQSPASSSILFVSGSGNIGMGTTTPARALEIVNSSGPQLRIRDGVSGANLDLQSDGSGQSRITWGGNGFIAGEASALRVFATVANGLWLETNTNTRPIEIKPNGVTAVYVSGTGNVGIGTSTPSKKLHVNVTASDDGIILAKSGSANNIFRVTMDGTSDRGEMFLNNGASSIFAVRPSSNPSYLNTGNNFGIGTTAPSAQLQVRGSGITASTTALRIENSNQSSSLVVLDNGNVGIGTAAPSSSLQVNGNAYISASFSTSSAALTVYKSGSTVFDVQGSQGQLFSITDSLSGSLFSVNDISGLPILEVFSDNTILMGDYLAPSLNTTERLTVNSGVTTLYAIPTASYDGAFFEYTIRSGSNARAGQIMGMWSGTSVNHTETTTTDFGNTSGFTFGMSISGSNMILSSSATTSGWTFKTIIRSI